MSDDRPVDAAVLAARLASAGATDLRLELVQQVDRLLADHQDRVYAFCLRFVGNPEQAADIAQETMIRAYQKLPTFRGESRFSTWLVAIARYECLNALRKRGDLLVEDGVLEATDPERSALASLRGQERDLLLQEAASTVLDPLEQEAIHLRYTEHLPLEQISAVLGLGTADGSRVVLQRCKRKLRAELRRRLEVLGHGSSFVRESVGP